MFKPTRSNSPDLSHISKNKTQQKNKCSPIPVQEDLAIYPKTTIPELKITMMRADYINKIAENYYLKLFSKSEKKSSDVFQEYQFQI